MKNELRQIKDETKAKNEKGIEINKQELRKKVDKLTQELEQIRQGKIPADSFYVLGKDGRDKLIRLFNDELKRQISEFI